MSAKYKEIHLSRKCQIACNRRNIKLKISKKDFVKSSTKNNWILVLTGQVKEP